MLSPDPLLLPLVDFGGCGKLAILTDRLNGLSVDESSCFSCGVMFDTERSVVMLGLEALWLVLKIEFGLLIFEGVRNALFDEDEEGSRDRVGESDEEVGCRILDMGSWGRADVGGGAGPLAAALVAAIVTKSTERERVHRISLVVSPEIVGIFSCGLFSSP